MNSSNLTAPDSMINIQEECPKFTVGSTIRIIGFKIWNTNPYTNYYARDIVQEYAYW